MAEEEELPEELKRLEITPILPQVKILDSNLPVQLNPFFGKATKDTDGNGQETTDNTDSTNEIQSIVPRLAVNCRRCRSRILDEIKYGAGITDSTECSRTPYSGILKQSLKRTVISSRGRGNRKALLRDPVLKAIQTCLQSQSNQKKSLLTSADLSVAPENKSNGQITTKGMSSFQNLIEECRNLLSDEVEFTGRLNQMCLSSRNSKNFTTMQTPKIPNGNSNKLRISRRQIHNTTSPSKSSLSPISLQEHQPHNNPNEMSLIQPSLLDDSISTTISLQHRSINSSSPEHPRCSTTCSQQAGNSTSTASNSDDVTIDELASYFDTFVHIPKKMSSMAEMMYI